MMAGEKLAMSVGPQVAQCGALELVLPACGKGLGEIIGQVNAPGLIEGFPTERSQVSAALSYPGTIKAFHYHLQQTDCWTPVKGLLQVALVDLRKGSPTLGVRNTLFIGPLRPWQVLIPPGVAHGYKVVGREEALLVYTTDRFYNPRDEGRIPYDDASIQYDWQTQRK
jgi:dTDP-4-dehydrorhamnose 3,5-epimerase